MRKRYVIPTAVVAVAVLSFVSYGAYTRSKPVDYARGGSAFAVDPSPSSSSSTRATPQPSVTAGPTPTATSSPTPGASTTAAPTLPRAEQTGVPAPLATAEAAGVLLPRYGTYGLKVEGSEKVDFGPLSFCSQSLPSTAKLVIAHAAGEGPTSVNVDLPYFSESGKHDERHVYRYTKDAVFLDYEIATVTCQGVRQSSDTVFTPPQKRVQLPLTVGDTWTNHGGDSDRTEDSSSRVARTETLTVAGRSVTTYVIETTTSFTGSETGSRSQTWWYAPSWAMPVKWTEQIDGRRSGAAYTENVTVTVTSAP